MIDKEMTFFVFSNLNTTVDMSEVFGWGLAGFWTMPVSVETPRFCELKYEKEIRGK